jgi:hypothetical protein
MEPGPVEVSAGRSSSDIRSSAKFTVTGKARVIKGGDRAFLSVATVTRLNLRDGSAVRADGGGGLGGRISPGDQGPIAAAGTNAKSKAIFVGPDKYFD